MFQPILSSLLCVIEGFVVPVSFERVQVLLFCHFLLFSQDYGWLLPGFRTDFEPLKLDVQPELANR